MVNRAPHPGYYFGAVLGGNRRERERERDAREKLSIIIQPFRQLALSRLFGFSNFSSRRSRGARCRDGREERLRCGRIGNRRQLPGCKWGAPPLYLFNRPARSGRSVDGAAALCPQARRRVIISAYVPARAARTRERHCAWPSSRLTAPTRHFPGARHAIVCDYTPGDEPACAILI